MDNPQLLTISEGQCRHGTLREREDLPLLFAPDEFDLQLYFTHGEIIQPGELAPLGPSICLQEFRFSYDVQWENRHILSAEGTAQWMNDIFYDTVSILVRSAYGLAESFRTPYVALAAHMSESQPVVSLNCPKELLTDEKPDLSEKLAALEEAHTAARKEAANGQWVLHPTVQLYVRR